MTLHYLRLSIANLTLIGLSLTRILTVNIILRAFKSFNTIYNSIYTFGYNNLFFNTHANFHMQFISQSVVSNQFKTNQYAIYIKSFQYFTINFETIKEECRSNFHKFETRERLKNILKRVVTP